MSHPLGTLHRWSSSHHARCSAPAGRVWRIVARGPRSWRCCAATRPLGPASTPAWPAACGPGWRMPPTTSSRRGASTRRPSSSGRANCWARPTSSAWRRDRTRPVLSRLVHTLLRQLVHTGEIGDPLADAVDALRASGDEAEVREIESLPAAARTVLAERLALHARNLTALVPRFAPGWMPRTNDRVAIPLAGGRIVLHGVFDLVVGLPQPRTASLCALGLSTTRAMGGGAAVTALPVAARDPPDRRSPVPAGATRVRFRSLRRRGRARGAPPGAGVAHCRVARPGRDHSDRPPLTSAAHG